MSKQIVSTASRYSDLAVLIGKVVFLTIKSCFIGKLLIEKDHKNEEYRE
jgi:hypothetical protein